MHLPIFTSLTHFTITESITLQWRHTGRDGVSNHQPYDCLFRRSSKKTQKLRVTVLCAMHYQRKGPLTRKMFPFDDVFMIFTAINSLIRICTKDWKPCRVFVFPDIYGEYRPNVGQALTTPWVQLPWGNEKMLGVTIFPVPCSATLHSAKFLIWHFRFVVGVWPILSPGQHLLKKCSMTELAPGEYDISAFR